MDKIKNIEFLKFLFIFIVIISHLLTTWGSLTTFFPDLYSEGAEKYMVTGLGAYIFYFISGIFLYYTNRNKEVWSVTKYTVKRYLRFFPLVFLYILVAVLIVIHNNNFSVSTVSNSFLYLFLLNSTGLPVMDLSFSVMNFLSSLFWASVIVYSLRRFLEEKYSLFAISLITIITTLFYFNYAFEQIPTNYFQNVYVIFDVFLLKGISGVGFGYLVSYLLFDKFNLSEKRREEIDYKSFGFFLWSLIEIALLFALCYCTVGFPKISNNEFIFVQILLVVCFLLKKGAVSNLFETGLSEKLGRYVFAIYVFHNFIVDALISFFLKHRMFVEQHILLHTLIYIISSILIGVIVYHLFEKPFSDFLKKKFKI